MTFNIRSNQIHWKTYKKGHTNPPWEKHVCFAFLRECKSMKQYLEVQFNNYLDIYIAKTGDNTISTEEWLTAVQEEFGFSGMFTILEQNDQTYTVQLDTTKLGYNGLLATLTMLRYPGEYFNVLVNYQFLKEKHTDLTNWEAFTLAHIGCYIEFEEKYGQYYYNNNHTLFCPAKDVILHPEKAFKFFKKEAPYDVNEEYYAREMREKFMTFSYAEQQYFDDVSVYDLIKKEVEDD